MRTHKKNKENILIRQKQNAVNEMAKFTNILKVEFVCEEVWIAKRFRLGTLLRWTYLRGGLKSRIDGNLWSVPVVYVLIAVPHTVDQIGL